jgi:hypothetical protein
MEETYHELDLEYTSVAEDLDGYSTPITGPLDHEYGAYTDNSHSLSDAYLSDEYFGAPPSDGGQNSDSKSQGSSRGGQTSSNLYGATLDEQMEKEIDYLPIKDWQGEFQTLLRMPDSYEKWRGIARLGLDFQHAASLYARVIVSECKLPENQKTIHTADVGGVAGGIKVICQGILFKVAVDKHGMYGSDANAAKSAGHEFKSTTAFFDLQLPDVQLPLMAIIDYRGFRVTAMSLLPISGNDTLIYGSSDGGRTVQDSDPHFNQLMERAGKLLNLRPHLCGREDPKMLAMPIDVEGHVTLKFRTKGSLAENGSLAPSGFGAVKPSSAKPSDLPSLEGSKTSTATTESYKRSYVVLDLARLFPAQMPLVPPEKGSKHRSYLYELLRPEYVKSYPVPLSSDAFSPFNLTDPNAKSINEDVANACHKLVTLRIPQFAAFLEKGTLSGLTPASELDCSRFVSLMHRQGINIRFLGVVRKCLSFQKTRRIALTEMVARVIKDKLNQTLRSTTETVQLPVDEPYREVVVEYLNKLFGLGADAFWKTEIMPAVLKKFAIKKLDLDVNKDMLTALEEAAASTVPEVKTSKLKKSRQGQSSEQNLRHYVDVATLWERVSELTGVILRMDSVRVMTAGLGISSSDIKDLRSRIRVTDVMNRAMAVWVSMDAKSKRGTEAFRLYARAHQLFSDCLEVSASNAATFYHWGQMLHEMAQHDFFKNSQNSLKLLKLGALPKLAQAVHLNPGFQDAHAELAWTLMDFLLHQSRFEAVNSKTTTTAALKDTTAILDRAGHHLMNSLGPLPERVAKSLSASTSSATMEALQSTQASTDPNTISALTSSHDSASGARAVASPSTLQSSSGSLPSSNSSPQMLQKSAPATQSSEKSSHASQVPLSASAGQTPVSSASGTTASQAGSIASSSPIPIKKKAKSSKKDKESQGTPSPNATQNVSSTASASLSTPPTVSTISSASNASNASNTSSAQKSSNVQNQKEENSVSKIPQNVDAWRSDDFQIRLDDICQHIASAHPSLFMALSFALWDHPIMHNAIFARGAQLEELDLGDASFMPKFAFTTISQVCPNLTLLRLRNAAFLDSITAGEMLCPADIVESTAAASPSPVAPTPSTSKPKISKIRRAFQGSRSNTVINTTANATRIYSTLPRLKSLTFSVCDHLTDIEDFDLLYWPDLQMLKFEKCGLSDGFFGSRINARQMPSLTSLVMSGSMVSDSSLNKLCTQFSSQLKVLDMSICLNMQFVSCFNHNVLNPNFTGLKALTHLDLSGCRSISPASVGQFAKTLSSSVGSVHSAPSAHHTKFPSLSNAIAASKSHPSVPTASLTFLNLDGCTSIGEDIWNSFIKKCPSLTSLSMEKSSATGVTLALVGQHCQRLERLHAPACKNLEPLSLLKVLQGCPSLNYLDASFWMWNKVELGPKIAKAWTSTAFPSKLALQQLFICAWSLETSLVHLLLSNSPNLTSLDLSNCMSLNPEIFTTIGTSCTKLEKIVANGFVLTDDSVEALALGCSKTLRVVSFLRAHELTDASLASLARCSNLKRLNLTHSPFISNPGIQMIVAACPLLTRIGLKGNKLLTPEFLFEKLRHQCAELKIEVDTSKTVFWNFPLP